MMFDSYLITKDEIYYELFRETSDIDLDKEYKEVITTEKPNTTLNTVAGHDHAKELMISTILSPIKFPEAFAG